MARVLRRGRLLAAERLESVRMRSNLVAVIMALIVVAFAGAAYYYWHGGGRSAKPVVGVVVDKSERVAGTEAGGKPLQQGLRVLTGESAEQEVFYVVRVRTEKGEEVEMQVPRDFFTGVQVGDTVSRASPDASPTIVKRSP